MDDAMFADLTSGLKQAAAHARGEDVPGLVEHKVAVPEDVDVAKIRQEAGLSQARFASGIGVPVATLRNWEQGRRRPEGPARVLLALLSKRPTIVEELLGEHAGLGGLAQTEGA